MDTNAVIAYFKGHGLVVSAVDQATWVGLSIVTYIEFLVFPTLSSQDADTFRRFCQSIVVVPLDGGQVALRDEIIRLRRDHRLKLPDAVVAGTAIAIEATLITADAKLGQLPDVAVMTFSP